MILSTPILVDPRSSQLDEQIEALAQGPGIYAIFMRDAPTHLSSCAFLRARVRRLLGESAAVSKQRLREQVQRIECWPTASRLETWLLLFALASNWFPDDYERRLRLRRPWFVGLSGDRFPRTVALNRLTEADEPLYGPFPSRDAAFAYGEAGAGLFQIRKCSDVLQPSLDHPGCIYGEMNQCLRPCQCAVSDEEYLSESARVAEFLRTNGTATRSSLLLARERASEDLDFELASHLHKRLERLNLATSLCEDPVSGIRTFGGVALTESPLAGAVRLWPMQRATWLPPLDVLIGSPSSEIRSPEIRSMDSTLREMLAPALSVEPDPAADRSAHLAILLRWYRSSYRDGEWLPDVPGKGISYRKLVGGISRLLKR